MKKQQSNHYQRHGIWIVMFATVLTIGSIIVGFQAWEVHSKTNSITEFLVNEMQKDPNVDLTSTTNMTAYFLSITDLEDDRNLEFFIGLNSGNTQSVLTAGYDSSFNQLPLHFLRDTNKELFDNTRIISEGNDYLFVSNCFTVNATYFETTVSVIKINAGVMSSEEYKLYEEVDMPKSDIEILPTATVKVDYDNPRNSVLQCLRKFYAVKNESTI